MASLLLRSIFRPQLLGLGLGLSMAAFHFSQRTPIRLDSGPVSNGYKRNAKTPVLQGGRVNPRAVRQISSGSILGLLAGMAVSAFSRPLALLIGLLVVGVQWAASYGINVLPYNKLQHYVTSINLRSIVQDHVTFKLSFGTTFALAAFMQF